jgi:plasmid maintenance system antidote protein VapI
MSRKSRYDTEVGRRVTEMIAGARTTQAGLADVLGMSRKQLNHMLVGRRNPHPDLEERARQALSPKRGK